MHECICRFSYYKTMILEKCWIAKNKIGKSSRKIGNIVLFFGFAEKLAVDLSHFCLGEHVRAIRVIARALDQ